MPPRNPPQPHSLDFVGTPYGTRETRFRTPPGVGSYIDPALRGDMAGTAAFDAGRPRGDLPVPKPYDWDGTGEVPEDLYTMASDLAAIFGDATGPLPPSDQPNRVATWLDSIYGSLTAKGEGCGLEPDVVAQCIIDNAQLGPHAVAYALQEAARTSDICNKYLIKHPMTPPVSITREPGPGGPLEHAKTTTKAKPFPWKWTLGGVGILAAIGTAIYFMTRGAKKRKNPCRCNPLQSGYQPCACRDCFETAISDDGRPALCHECEAAGCDVDGRHECERSDAYGVEENPYGGKAGFTSVDGGALAYAVSPLLNPTKKKRRKARRS